MTCSCCLRSGDFQVVTFGTVDWCDDCATAGCDPYKPSRSCPRVRQAQQRRLGVLANGVRLMGRYQNRISW